MVVYVLLFTYTMMQHAANSFCFFANFFEQKKPLFIPNRGLKNQRLELLHFVCRNSTFASLNHFLRRREAKAAKASKLSVAVVGSGIAAMPAYIVPSAL